MSKSDKAASDQVECPLRDDELAAATGGIFNAFAKFGDTKGETPIEKTPSTPSPVPLPYPVLVG